MLEFQQDNQFFLFNLTEKPTEPASFFESAFWKKQQRITGSAKGRGTTYFLNTKDLFGVDTALRHYYRGGLWGKFNKDRYHFQSFTETRSVAEFQLLNQLHQAGVAVPKPIAARVKKGKLGICYQADILIEKIENAQDLTALLQTQQLPNDIWQAIGKLIRQLHDLQICHTDLNAHNILVQQLENEQKCWLIDFDKCGQKSGDSWKQGNLERLHRSFVKEVGRMNIQFNKDNWTELLKGYNT